MLYRIENDLSSLQKAMRFNEAQKNDVKISQLEKAYHDGLHNDSTLVVFPNQDEYMEAYKSMLQDFGKHLTKNGFFWEKTAMYFNQIYFDKSGKIDYFLYSFRSGLVSEKHEEEFKRLLNSIIKDYTFPLSAKVNFAQSSPVRYQANVHKKPKDQS